MRLINVAIIAWCFSIIMYSTGFFWVCFSSGLVSSLLIIYYFRRKILFKKREIESTENRQSTENNLENKSDKKTIICAETCFTGDIVSDADILINGKYIGNILCKQNTVIVTKTGIVTGSILAKKSIIDGQIEGRVESSLIEIQKNGMIEGEIYSENLSIEDGGFFIGISKKITVDLNKKILERNNVQEHKKHQKIDAANTVALKEKKEKIS